MPYVDLPTPNVKSTGICSVTNLSASATIIGDVRSGLEPGLRFKTTNYATVYIIRNIALVGGNTVCVLNATYGGTTNANATYNIYKDNWDIYSSAQTTTLGTVAAVSGNTFATGTSTAWTFPAYGNSGLRIANDKNLYPIGATSSATRVDLTNIYAPTFPGIILDTTTGQRYVITGTNDTGTYANSFYSIPLSSQPQYATAGQTRYGFVFSTPSVTSAPSTIMQEWWG